MEICKPILVLENLPNEDLLSDYILNLRNLGYKVTGKAHANTILEKSIEYQILNPSHWK